ncbi:PD-(D/E)XK nuclease-like domain-containing protein [Lysobacter enzymogenes]|uniref:PD-(D/E)XK nuclease-like domain-containing protein n=1 Tax=Lysobacter enzymogenes TaxID=69 RepID=UPI000899855D|nr:PD-(D/E)XK nuclease-like domain-containing protein [Lysobacter enzymogenes]SDY08550.1 PDDEXK-like protein of unknown function [Lysobacter enzymogenes]
MTERGQILLDLPADEYHQRELGVASSTVLKLLHEKTPAHYRLWVDSAHDNETPALLFGRAYHCRVFEPERYALEFAVEPEGAPARPTDAMRNAQNPSESSVARVAFWDRWDAENAGKTVLSRFDADRIEAMHAALMANPVVRELLFDEDGANEVSLRWIDPDTGVACKARVDRWKRTARIGIDLKSTDDASPLGFAKAVAKYGYHIQQAHYCAGAAAIDEAFRRYLIVAQEKAAPYLAAVYALDAASESRGFELRQEAMQTMAACLSADEWPGYGPETQELTLPAWAYGDAMEISYVE